MNLLDIVRRTPAPEPWSEGEKIPWNEPGFSARMLAEHLSQAHDHASRRFAVVDRQVAWIHETVLGCTPTRVLDLGCGPGLYASRLARLGHSCFGIDFGPASVAYAREEATRDGLDCRYALADIRTAEFGSGYGLAMLIFGEFNVFRAEEAAQLLCRVHAALAPGGVLLLEPHLYGVVEAEGKEPASWYTSPSGLFSSKPHLVLTENFWDPGRGVTTHRHYVIDAATGEVTRHADSMQAYTEGDYRALLEAAGFQDVLFYPSLTGTAEPEAFGLCVVTSRRA